MNLKTNATISKLRKAICLLLGGAMLATGLTSLASCNSKSDDSSTTAPAETTNPAETTTPVDPIEHLVKSEDGKNYSLVSPDGTLSFNITVDEGVSYNLIRKDTNGSELEWIRNSNMGVQLDTGDYYRNAAALTDVSITEIDRSFPLLGNQSTVTDHCFEAVFTFEQEGYTYYLDARAYDNGIAFRYRLPGDEKTSRKPTSDLTTYKLRTDTDLCWYGVNSQDYESPITSYDPTKQSRDTITAPLTAELKDQKGYIAIMEAALTDSFPGANMEAMGSYTYTNVFDNTPGAVKGDIVTGWRLVNVADDLNGLVNNYNIYCVNEPMDEKLFADTTWIEPGKSTWSWNVNYQGPSYEQMLDYTNAAGELGFEYNIIDEGWWQWSNYATKLKDIGTLGESLNVKQVLWGAITRDASRPDSMQTEAGVDDFLNLLETAHLYGAKIDFWWSETNYNTTSLQKYILTEAAERKYVINFHGCNKNTGFNVTYPNEVTREAIRGLENIGVSHNTNYETYTNWLNAQLYTRFLCGHADWTPSMNNVMQIASMILIDSPFLTVSADPAKIMESPALELIKAIPTVWDRTVVLSPSQIGEYSVYAKQKDGVWFVGGIASDAINDATVNLAEFIDEEGTYVAEIWTEKNGQTVCETKNVTKDDVISLGNIADNSGFVIRLSKLSLSQYGGKIDGAITVTSPAGATVKYTTDGSDPRTSSTAVACDGSITLTASCRLKVAITEGDGKGTMLSYQFNKFGIRPTFRPEVVIGDGSSEVKFDLGGVNGKIYYTTDGSEPTESSPEAGASVTVTESCTVKYLVVTDEERFSNEVEVKVISRISSITPDIALTDAKALTATAGWGAVHYDTSMSVSNGLAAHPISLGGTDMDNGTTFDRGLSANAISVFTYSVPADVTRFVGTFGIDDCVYANTASSGVASVTCEISFDGVKVYTSETMKRGDYVQIDVEVPAGAQVIEIRFGDAGDGITCDNASLGNPGWMK